MNKPIGWDDIIAAENDREAQKEFLRKKLPEYVASITKKDPNPKKRNYWLCPFPECKDTEHANSTGGAFSITADKRKFTCFSCHHSGDIFDLIGYMHGIKSGKQDRATMAAEFKQEFAIACELFHLQPDFTPDTATGKDGATAPSLPEGHTDLIEGATVYDVPPAADPAQPEQPEGSGKADFSEYLKRCIADLKGSAGEDYLHSRGFTDETIARFLLGYDKEKGLITIPYGNHFTYYATRTIEGKTFNKPSTEQAGPEPIYNGKALTLDTPCFICESQLDAISLAQAGGTAAALGGTGINKLLAYLKENGQRRCLVLCFDNDDAGRRAQKEAAEKLEGLGADFMPAHFTLEAYGETPPKDANDMLRANPEQLAKDIAAICEEARAHDLESGSVLCAVGDYQGLFKKHQTEPKQRISTGFPTLDIALYGGLMNELYILSAETSIGKSAIACSIAQNIAQQNIDVLYYALEMGRDEFIARGASMISREVNKKPIPYGEILNYKYDADTGEFYKRAYSEYEPYVEQYMSRYGQHLYFIEGGFYGKTALQIAQTAETFKKERGITQLVIVVDYLQRLKAEQNDRSQRDAMSITSAAVQVLGNLASQSHNTVIAISSISNAQKGQTVTDAAGKYSGDIAYTGGILLGWNWHGYTDTKKEDEKEATRKLCKERGYREMILEVLKQRSGERDNKLTLFYYPAYNYITAPTVKSGTKVQPHKK